MNETSSPSVVVVGVDGSANAASALRWAARYAECVGAELHAVIAWDNLMGFGFAPLSAEAFEREARTVLERTITRVLGDRAPTPLTTRVVRGNPTAVLVAESKGADLLVVGDRGYGGFAGLLLGSVSENCVREALCSVVVVRPD